MCNFYLGGEGTTGGGGKLEKQIGDGSTKMAYYETKKKLSFGMHCN